MKLNHCSYIALLKVKHILVGQTKGGSTGWLRNSFYCWGAKICRSNKISTPTPTVLTVVEQLIASPLWSQAGFIRATMGTMGLVRARAAQPIPARAPSGLGPWQPMHGHVKQPIHVQSRSNPVCCLDWARTGQNGLAPSNPARAPAGLTIWAVFLQHKGLIGGQVLG